ncbi:MAG: B12-binding domain-containing radical SAM protein [bacterium]|nr:B12-binding domain-containing radical SAM protein [bacterium]
MKRVYLHEFNILMGRKVYLPNVSGMLRAFAETKKEIRANYQFMPFVFIRGKPETITAQWDNPSVLAFSSSVWNHQLNLALAKLGREMFPSALIVFGGPHVPHEHGTEEFLRKHPHIDVIVIKDGEATFADLLIQFLNTRDFSGVQGVAFLSPETGKYVRTADRPVADVNEFPSPYLAGLYDGLMANRGDTEYQVIIETNRGCPFSCGFCYWGGRNKKVLMFDLERIRGEVEWLGTQKVPYVFGADANFGMIPRDKEIAEIFVHGKERNQYPLSFRVCFGKNAEDRVFEVAKLLERADLTKGVTVSFQSTDPVTLKNIGRGNIRIEVYRNLICRYRKEKIPIYTELILGLPGETYKSFALGLNEVFEAGLYDQIGIFFCTVLPNTPMADPRYVMEHGIVTKEIDLVEPHASARKEGEVVEREDIVVATKTMPLADWKKSAMLGWMAQTLHGLKLGFFVALYLFHRFGIKYTELFEHLINCPDDGDFPILKGAIAYYREYLDAVLSGGPQCVFLKEFGEISWQIEEATFLQLSENLNGFYREFMTLTRSLLENRGLSVNEPELEEVFRYQMARIASLGPDKPREYTFSLNAPESFDKLLNDETTTLNLQPTTGQILTVQVGRFNSREEFANHVIWYGRRDSRAVEKACWRNKI